MYADGENAQQSTSPQNEPSPSDRIIKSSQGELPDRIRSKSPTMNQQSNNSSSSEQSVSETGRQSTSPQSASGDANHGPKLDTSNVDSDRKRDNDRTQPRQHEPATHHRRHHHKSGEEQKPPADKKRARFDEKYRRGSVIGKGSFATVYKGQLRATHQRVAIKTVERGKLNEKLITNLEAEIQILQGMSHDNVVKLIDCTTTETEFILVMEYCSLGDLSHFMNWNNRSESKKHAPPPEIEAILDQYPPPQYGGINEDLMRALLVQLADALRFLRDRNLVHRDIKPQNLLLCPSNDEDDRTPVLKLADFGFARVLPNASLAETLCGSPLYMAPEILHHEKYGAKADLWSVGTVLYQLVTGIPPFTAGNYVELHRVIERCNDNIVFPDKVQVSQDVRKIILGLLKKSPAERMGFTEFFAAPICRRKSINDNGNISPADSPAFQPKKHTDTKLSPQPDQYFPPTPSSPPEPPITGNLRVNESAAAKERRHRHSKPTALEEQEYVVVEKRTVQVNALADELAGSPAARGVDHNSARNNYTNAVGGNRRDGLSRPIDAIKRRSSINYGTSPNNALSRALHFAGIRMRDRTPSSAEPISPIDGIGASNNGGECKALVTKLESLATKANVVCLFAQVKFNQIGDDSMINFESDAAIESPDVRDMERMASGSSPVNAIALSCEKQNEEDSFTKLAPEATILVAEEALVLYLKVLSLLAKAMTLASNWLSTHDDKLVTQEMNIIVQWIRQKFNKCIKYADYVKTVLDGQPLSGVSGNKLIFDRALEMSRGAAVNELVDQDLEGCESSYSTAMWMLEAVLEVGEDDLRLEPEDRRVVDKFVASISHRLTVLRQKMAAA